ncbi:MAG TPA: HipA family kinase [Candidatus Angelobacter sp.]|nr:HipA family kinase [Candidatus Angelobacter sp.]
MPSQIGPTNPTECVSAVQHIRKMRGGAQAHLLRASDNHYYVTKFRNNPQAVRILANEYLASKLGTYLGLPMAEVAIVSVPEWLIANSPELKIDLGGYYSVPCASGLQFGSRYVTDPLGATVFDYLPESMLKRVRNLKDFTRALAFDKWTGNADGRQAVFTKTANKRFYHAVFIDHGYCFNAGEWDFPDSPLRGVYARNHVYADVRGWNDFEPALSRIEDIDAAQIWNIAREIPEEWCQSHAEGLELLIDSLHQRRLTVRNLISDFRNSSRNPFPNWTAQTSLPANTTQNKPKEEKTKMTDQKFKAVFVLNSETQSFKPTAHNLGADLAMEQFSADPNARIIDQSEQHRNPDPLKCRACKKQAEELTKQNVEASSAPEPQEELAAQESESD